MVFKLITKLTKGSSSLLPKVDKKVKFPPFNTYQLCPRLIYTTVSIYIKPAGLQNNYFGVFFLNASPSPTKHFKPPGQHLIKNDIKMFLF